MVSTIFLKNYFNDNALITNADSYSKNIDESLLSFEKMLDSKRGEMFTLGLGSLDFIPRGSSFTTRIKHPDIKDWVYIIFVKNMKGEVTAFRANCPYENEKIIRNGLVYGNKLVCEHHGCEFHIDTGKVEKYPCMTHLFKFPIIPSEKVKNTQNKRVLALYKDPKSEKIILMNKNNQKGFDNGQLDLNMYQYKLPQDRKPLQYGMGVISFSLLIHNKKILKLYSTQRLKKIFNTIS
jgi:nitrite reductase/ring-hydroxylating ferredoxin subunit